MMPPPPTMLMLPTVHYKVINRKLLASASAAQQWKSKPVRGDI